MHSVRAYKMIFAVLERRSAYTTLDKMVTVFINNICCFIIHFTNNLVIISWFVIAHFLFIFVQIKNK